MNRDESNLIPNGVYLVYRDGHYELFSGNNPKTEVKYVVIKHNDIAFAISLKESVDVQLLDDDSKDEQEESVYYPRECDALFDFNGQKNTERLVARNTKLKNLLKNSEYIPSLGQLNLMAHYKDGINDALEYIGKKPLASTYYWSSTENSTGGSWAGSFGNGNTNAYSKYNRYRVRAVAAFTFML